MYLNYIASYLSTCIILECLTLSSSDVSITATQLFSLVNPSLNALYFLIPPLRRITYLFLWSFILVDICIWCCFMCPFTAHLIFPYCWFCLEHTTLYILLIWCYYFSYSCHLSFFLAPLPLLPTFLDVSVLFSHPFHIQFPVIIVM